MHITFIDKCTFVFDKCTEVRKQQKAQGCGYQNG